MGGNFILNFKIKKKYFLLLGKPGKEAFFLPINRKGVHTVLGVRTATRPSPGAICTPVKKYWTKREDVSDEGRPSYGEFCAESRKRSFFAF